mmetsp:Transcript_4922/g.9219  ORF Transcript_4922/g.9219 Transcript_4922/m.9219 type:complete len:85 (-) Transcript_4922:1739-1993(-)
MWSCAQLIRHFRPSYASSFRSLKRTNRLLSTYTLQRQAATLRVQTSTLLNLAFSNRFGLLTKLDEDITEIPLVDIEELTLEKRP